MIIDLTYSKNGCLLCGLLRFHKLKQIKQGRVKIYSNLARPCFIYTSEEKTLWNINLA